MKLKKIKLFEKILTKEFILYVVFGVLTTVVSMGSFWIFNRVFESADWQGILSFFNEGKNYAYMDSNILSWVCAVAFAFVTNKLFVFESKSWKASVALSELGAFVSARLFSLLIDEALMLLFISVLKMEEMIAKLLVQIVIVILNYIFSKIFVFKKKSLQNENDVI